MARVAQEICAKCYWESYEMFQDTLLGGQLPKVTTHVICMQNIIPRLYMSEHTKHNIPRKSSFNNFFIDIRRQLRVDEKYYKSENIKTPKQIHIDEMFNARLVRMLQKKTFHMTGFDSAKR